MARLSFYWSFVICQSSPLSSLSPTLREATLACGKPLCVYGCLHLPHPRLYEHLAINLQILSSLHQ
jgi:hypothetical protein